MPEKRKRGAKKAAKTPTKQPTPRDKKPRTKTARTAGGKHASPQVLAEAAIDSQEGFRERTEAGHRAAGRTPPSQAGARRSSGATRKVVDTSIRDYDAGVTTEDEKLLQAPSDSHDFTRRSVARD